MYMYIYMYVHMYMYIVAPGPRLAGPSRSGPAVAVEDKSTKY